MTFSSVRCVSDIDGNQNSLSAAFYRNARLVQNSVDSCGKEFVLVGSAQTASHVRGFR